MKYIITEEQNLSLMVARRLDAVDEFVDLRLKTPFPFDFCQYEDRESFLDTVISWVNEEMYYGYYSDIDDNTQKWHKIWNLHSMYIIDKHTKKIFDFYKNRCGKQ
jgi:hypothetical protein